MPLSEMTNIGAYIGFEVAFAPASLDESADPSADNGDAIDLQGLDWPASGKLILSLGAAAGGPTAIAAFAKLQHSDATASGWEDFEVRGDAIQTPNVTAASGEASVDVDLSGAKRYVRAVIDVDLTGGTTPSVMVCAILVIGGTVDLPA